MRQIQETYQESGNVRLEFKQFAFLSADSATAAEASLCAADQEEFWAYHDTLYASQGNFGVSDLKRYAETLDMDTEAFANCLDTGKYRQGVQDLLTEGRAKGVSSTPTFLINGVKVTGAQPFEAFQLVIEEELSKVGG